MIRLLINKIKNRIIFDRFARTFRAKNTHNFTTPASIFNIDNVTIGKATYGVINVLDYGNDNAKVRIGSFCSIANGVKFLSGGALYEYIFNLPILYIF